MITQELADYSSWSSHTGDHERSKARCLAGMPRIGAELEQIARLRESDVGFGRRIEQVAPSGGDRDGPGRARAEEVVRGVTDVRCRDG